MPPGSKSQSPSWNISRKGGSNPISMAEPTHRIPPGGVTSGESLRDVPKSCVQQVKEICLFYVSKCSGKYIDNKAAARYVHQMAEEVIMQLAGVASEIRRNRADPEIYQALLDDWNEHFPPSLGALGSPKAIAALVASQAKEIAKLKEDLKSEQRLREQDVSGILRSMDAQLHAYRTSVMNDRRQIKVLFDQQLKDYEDKMHKLNFDHQEETTSIEKKHQFVLSKLRDEFENKLKEMEDQMTQVKKESRERLIDLRDKVQMKINLKDEKIEKLKEKCKDLKEKYQVLAIMLHDDMQFAESEDEDDDLDDLDDDAGSTLSEFNDELEKFEVDPLESRPRTPRTPKQQREKSEKKILDSKLTPRSKAEAMLMKEPVNQKKSDSEQITYLKETNLAALNQIRKLEKKYQISEKVGNDLKTNINKLTAEIKEFLDERVIHLRRLKELEEINESLRRALGIKLTEDGHNVDIESIRNIKETPELMCHTPHFLDHADRTAPLKPANPLKLHPYVTEGYF